MVENNTECNILLVVNSKNKSDTDSILHSISQVDKIGCRVVVLVDIKNYKYYKQRESIFTVIRAPNEAVFSALNKCTKVIKSKYVIFISDSLLPGDINKVLSLSKKMKKYNFDAISPTITTLYENQLLYNGESFSQALFYGYFMREHVMPDTSGYTKQADTIAIDCFCIKSEVFEKIGGFSEKIQMNHFGALELSCKIRKTGYICGHITDIKIQIKSLPNNRNMSYGKEFIYILSKYGVYFKEDGESDYRGFICPSGFHIPKRNKGILLLFSHELSFTGAPVVLFDTAIELKKMGFVVIFMSCQWGDLAQDILDAGIPILWDKECIIGREAPDHFIDISVQLLLDNIIDVFDKTLFNTLVTHNIITRYIGKKIPIYWWIHEGIHYWSFMVPYLPKKLSDNIQVLTGGEYVKDTMKAYGCKFETKVLNYGIKDICNQFANNKLEIQIPGKENSIKFLVAGAIQSRKGQDIFVEAIKLLPKKYQEVSDFYFLGSNIEWEITQKVLEFCESRDNVHYLGNFSREELYSLYLMIDALVSPSRDDPMPVVATENMMFEGVCICSNHTGTAYYIDHGVSGYVFENENAAGLAVCMEAVIDRQGELSEMKKASRKIFLENFDMKIFRDNLKKFI